MLATFIADKQLMDFQSIVVGFHHEGHEELEGRTKLTSTNG